MAERIWLSGREDKEQANKNLAEAWIEETIEPDSESGMSDDNFILPPSKQIGQKMLDTMRARGIIAYSGSGNFFLVDIKGDAPRIIQRRPLAQRYVRLEVE